MAAALPAIRGYRVLRLLGEGGMGRVFLAEDETLERRVAIKMISGADEAQAATRARFLREARAMAGVEHPHVVRVYAIGEHEGQPYLVMEYVEGETLAARLARVTQLAVADALRIAREVAQALAAAWTRGIVHRDVKPANILLDSDDRVKVADFGLARRTATDDPALTGSGSVVGTPHYISPEQARGEQADFRSDVYSLGIVLHEMLAGQRPFTGRSPVEVISKHLTEPLPSIRARRPDAPEGVVTLVDWMTAKTPQARPASYADLVPRLTPEGSAPDLTTEAEIESATSSMPKLPRAPAAVAAAPPPPRAAGRRRLWLSLVAAALLLGAGLAAFGPFQRRHGSFAVAVVPFYGPDAESEREGRVFASLVESALVRRLPEDDVDVLGVDETRKALRSPRAAKALAEKLSVNAVVWGESLLIGGELALAPRVSTRDGELIEDTGAGDTLAAQAAGAIEARRARAAAVAERVALLYSGSR